jgi:type II secretory pathway pseudopilin PulG
MIALAIIAILIGIGITSYEYYLKKAKVAEAVIFQGKLRGDFNAAYQLKNELPMKIADSVAWTASRQNKQKVSLSEHRIKMPESNLIEEYWYDADIKQKRAWIAIKYSKNAFPECGGECAVHLGFQISKGGDLYSYCGRWTSSSNWGKFPLDMMGPDCQEECVSCMLNKARQLK